MSLPLLSECAKTFLSVVPGKFLLFDKGTPAENMKDAERSTYTFIAEMEEGVSVSSQDLVKKNAGGASLHPGNPSEKKEEGPEDGIKVLSISGSSPSNMPPKKSAAPAAGPAFAIGEKVQALWTDGKWYAAVIKKVIPETKYQVVSSIRFVAFANRTAVYSVWLVAAPGAWCEARCGVRVGLTIVCLCVLRALCD